ncbi:MAG: hypothetical protein ACO2Z9_00020 [Crocinitomicaceae bacterium]
MKLNTLIALLCTSFLLGACFSEKDEDIVHHDFNEDHVVTPVIQEIPADTQKIWLSEEAVEIDLDSLILSLDSLEFFIDTTNSTDDSTFIYLELGSSLADLYFGVKSMFDSVSTTVMYQFETSLTISNEGPHCDLIEWKHFTSVPDTLLAVDSKGVYQFKNGYEDSLSSAFPEVSMKDVRKAILNSCGEHWLEHTKESNSIHEYPFSVSISREIIRILITNNEGEIIREKFIIFEIPMGC